jgi:predicted O-methyltransferase YrrM
MAENTWNAVDLYFSEKLIPADEALDRALQASEAAGLPAINVAPNQGKFLMVLARITRAKRILELGTLGGYSTIWLARALPDGGQLVTLEVNPKHADVARENIARAGLANIVTLRVGAALETLRSIEQEGGAPFDFIFIDADKPNTAAYFASALRLSRPGSVIVVDNVVRKGGLVDVSSADENVRGMRDFVDTLARQPRVTATAIQTVGVKGYDGFAIAIVDDPA